MGLTALAVARYLTGFEPQIPKPRPVLALRAAALKRAARQAPP